MKKILFLILVLLISTITTAEVYDASDWSIESINEMKAYNAFRASTFSDYKEAITRQDFIYIAVRVYELIDGKEITINPDISFTDTKDEYALKGATVNLTNGIGNNKFGPDSSLTREQLATFMMKIVNILELNQKSVSQVKFDDHDEISDWAIDAIYKARGQGFISGVGNNNVDPKGTASVEMTLVVANKLLKQHNIVGQDIVIADVNIQGRYQLETSTNQMYIWTDFPSENIFKDEQIPESRHSGVEVYLAKNEFEPFQLAFNPSSDTDIKFDYSNLPSGMSMELHKVDYIYLEKETDSLGRTGWYPDPLWPVEFKTNIEILGQENTTFWFTLKTDETILAGDYEFFLYANETKLPIRVHVFDFSIPKELHVKSQINLSTHSILEKYGVEGTKDDYWLYVELVKQFMIDHRLTPKSALWSGGLTGSGGAPYINYDSVSGEFSDPHGIWGFENPANRYIKGENGNNNPYIETEIFNEGIGFPSFMAMTFQNNDASDDQRPSRFEGVNRSRDDWYQNDDVYSLYNTKWFKYIGDLENYLIQNDYVDKTYYYMANEPQDQEDYDAVSWYSQQLKTVAPQLKLMVSEEPKPEIYDNDKYPGAKIDIWLPVLNNYDPKISWEREKNYDEKTWIYFLYGTKPPYYNPITIDHPSIEQKFTGWFLWKYRLEGIAHYSFNNWGDNVWENPMTSGHNGDNFMLYPPSKSNTPITFGETNHRLVSSIRMELMRDSLEDYEYLYRLNNSIQPEVYSDNDADREVDKIIHGLTSYNRDSYFMYMLRKNIGLKIGGKITEIPEIENSQIHDRSLNTKSHYINFQDPSDQTPLILDGKTYLRIGWQPYDESIGYGWYGDLSHVKYQYNNNESNVLKASVMYDDWGREKVFEFDLANGFYDVTIGCGWIGRIYEHNQIIIEGITFIENEATNPYLVRSNRIEVRDNKLTMEMGIFDEYTMINYLEIVPVQ